MTSEPKILIPSRIAEARLAHVLSKYAYLRALTNHDATFGAEVEHIIKGLLIEHLPGSCAVDSGFIISTSGNTSGQIDAIIHAGRALPVVGRMAGAACVLGYSAKAAIEIKSCLTTQSLDEIAIFCERIKAIKEDGVQISLYAVSFVTDMKEDSIVEHVNKKIDPSLKIRLFILRIRPKDTDWPKLYSSGEGALVQWSEERSRYVVVLKQSDIISPFLKAIVPEMAILCSESSSIGDDQYLRHIRQIF